MTHPETEADIRWAVGNAKRLERENERLRAALDEIVRVGTWVGTDERTYTSQECCIAKDALNQQQTGAK